jgi:hypothetical protein
MNCNISWTRSFVMNCHHLCEIQRKKMQNGGMVSIWSVPQCLWQILSPSYSPLMNPFLHSTFSCFPDGNTHRCDCFDFGSRSAGLHFHVSCFSRRNEEAFFLASTMTESDGSCDRPSPGYSELTSSAIQKMVCASLTLFSCASTMCYTCSSPYFVFLACARRCATR